MRWLRKGAGFVKSRVAPRLGDGLGQVAEPPRVHLKDTVERLWPRVVRSQGRHRSFPFQPPDERGLRITIRRG